MLLCFLLQHHRPTEAPQVNLLRFYAQIPQHWGFRKGSPPGIVCSERARGCFDDLQSVLRHSVTLLASNLMTLAARIYLNIKQGQSQTPTSAAQATSDVLEQDSSTLLIRAFKSKKALRSSEHFYLVGNLAQLQSRLLRFYRRRWQEKGFAAARHLLKSLLIDRFFMRCKLYEGRVKTNGFMLPPNSQARLPYDPARPYSPVSFDQDTL